LQRGGKGVTERGKENRRGGEQIAHQFGCESPLPALPLVCVCVCVYVCVCVCVRVCLCVCVIV
jgi:hypothetical protein